MSDAPITNLSYTDRWIEPTPNFYARTPLAVGVVCFTERYEAGRGVSGMHFARDWYVDSCRNIDVLEANRKVRRELCETDVARSGQWAYLLFTWKHRSDMSGGDFSDWEIIGGNADWRETIHAAIKANPERLAIVPEDRVDYISFLANWRGIRILDDANDPILKDSKEEVKYDKPEEEFPTTIEMSLENACSRLTKYFNHHGVTAGIDELGLNESNVKAIDDSSFVEWISLRSIRKVRSLYLYAFGEYLKIDPTSFIEAAPVVEVKEEEEAPVLKVRKAKKVAARRRRTMPDAPKADAAPAPRVLRRKRGKVAKADSVGKPVPKLAKPKPRVRARA